MGVYVCVLSIHTEGEIERRKGLRGGRGEVGTDGREGLRRDAGEEGDEGRERGGRY